MICPNCGTENAPGAKFCTECASRLAAVCPACGTQNAPTAKFCSECATPLTAARPPAVATLQPAPVPRSARPDAPPVAERRLVSVLFADLVGFTNLAEGRDPEETRELLSRYFDLAADVVARYGGVVEKFIGDAVMAVWGTPTAREDDAERAVRAGLELVDAVGRLGPGLQARAGVLTGEAAVTLGAVGQGMVAGDLVNTASRLQSVALPGTVLVGEATQRAASGAIAFEPAGDQALKGKTSPVPAWRALRVVAERGGRNRSETLEAPFVGRETELRLLKDLFHATSREGRARLVSVIGPAGIGKSRLAWEFLKYIDGLVEAVWWHDGRSPAYGEGITFWALGEMVRGRGGRLETDDEATTRAKVAEALAQHVPDESERRWIEPALLALLGFGPGVRSEQLFGAWRTFFERLAATAPVVMVFEDFHYADAGLLDFVDHLMEWSRTSPIYVLTLARPELIDKRSDWGAGKRNFTSLYLEPLSEPAMRELLRGLVPGLPEPAARAIVARAGGMPLYAVETVRMLVAEGKLRLEGEAYIPVGDLTRLAVPETLTALIASRLDGLSAAERSVVHDAAVLGQSFTLAGLSAVSGLPEAELEPLLRALVRREILTLEADPRSPERGQYGFVQALIREVAYNTLAKQDRKVRHLAAARFFEATGSDELAGALAGHYLAAHANAHDGPERDALAGQARIALRAAADRASELGSHEHAVAFYEQALSITTDPADRVDLLLRAGQGASYAARHDAAEHHLRAALEIQRGLGDRVAIARATTALTRGLMSAYRVADALELLRPAVAEFEDLAAEPDVIELGGQLARAHMMAGDARSAIEASDRVLEAAELRDEQAITADVLISKGTALGYIGRTIEGLALLRAGQETAEALGLGTTLVRAMINRTSVDSARDPRGTLAIARTGLPVARRLGMRHAAVVLAGNGAESAFRTGDWDEALAELELLLAEEVEPADRIILVQASTYFRACRGLDTVAALRELHESAATEDVVLETSVALASGMVAFAEGRLGEAHAEWRRVAGLSVANLTDSVARAGRAALWVGDDAGLEADLATLDASGVHGPAVEADRATMRAGLLALQARSRDALVAYRAVLRAWSDLGCEWDEALAGLDMALLLDPTDPDVRAATERSRGILVRLGARPFVERLDAALSGGPAARPAAQPELVPADAALEAAT
ncbi:MAG TPA: adenylate/guanylate cyclase domain-containing protein [Candidatus Dormibacteraeota bacterium]|nr:adenylate/guanylate cyclase domain-containing protein [Candidatus Dormibacteraeota bacterium]